MRSFRTLAPLMLLSVVFLPGGVPLQSIPDHPAGLVCVVHTSWCAMLVPGPAGAPCSCPTLYGRTTGVLR